MGYDPLGLIVTGSRNQEVWDINDCTGDSFNVTSSFSTWRTGNTQIATANQKLITGVAAGSTANYASGYLLSSGIHSCPTLLRNPSGGVNVVPTVAITTAPTGVTIVNGSAPGAHEVFVQARCDPQGQVNPQFNWSITQGGQYASVDTQTYGTGSVMGVIGVAASPQNGVTVSVTCTDLNTSLMSSPQTAQMTAQQPSALSIIQPDSTSFKTNCASGQCGAARTFTYQVKDQWGTAIAESGLDFWDYITTGSQNTCGFDKYAVTCSNSVTSGQQTGSCGQTTDSSGQFLENPGLTICATACAPASNGQPQQCTGSCSTTATQTWVVNGFNINKSLTYQCNSISVQ